MSAEAVEQQQIKKAEVPGLPTEGVSSKEPVAPQGSMPSKPGGQITVKRATFGDETSATDVTKTLVEQLDKDKYIKVTADQSLIPLISWGSPKKVKLTQQEEEYAQEKAEDECGGGQNKSCIEVRKQQKMQLLLKEKEDKTGAADKVVKGRRLTVTYVDESGREQTVVVPDGSVFEAGEAPKGEVNPFSVNAILFNFLKIGATVVAVLGWVYSVVATYRTFLEAGYRWPAYVATAAAIFFPYSGFFIMFGFFLFTSIFTKKPAAIAAYVPKTIESIAKRPGATVSSVISQ